MTVLIELRETWLMTRLWSGVSGVSTLKSCAELTVLGTRLELSKRYWTCSLVHSMVIALLTGTCIPDASADVIPSNTGTGASC